MAASAAATASPCSLPALPSWEPPHFHRGGSMSPLAAVREDATQLKAGEVGKDGVRLVLPPASPSLLGRGVMCQGGRADQAPGMCGKDPGGIQPLCHLGFFVIVLCVVVLPFPPPRFIFSSCHPIIFFPRLSCWPPCLPYGWGYLRRISQRIAP